MPGIFSGAEAITNMTPKMKRNCDFACELVGISLRKIYAAGCRMRKHICCYLSSDGLMAESFACLARNFVLKSLTISFQSWIELIISNCEKMSKIC